MGVRPDRVPATGALERTPGPAAAPPDANDVVGAAEADEAPAAAAAGSACGTGELAPICGPKNWGRIPCPPGCAPPPPVGTGAAAGSAADVSGSEEGGP